MTSVTFSDWPDACFLTGGKKEACRPTAEIEIKSTKLKVVGGRVVEVT